MNSVVLDTESVESDPKRMVSIHLFSSLSRPSDIKDQQSKDVGQEAWTWRKDTSRPRPKHGPFHKVS